MSYNTKTKKGVYMDFYDRLNGILAEKRVTKRKLCIDLDIPYTTLASMFQRRSNSIDLDTIKKIASYLDTTLEYLATGNEQYKFKSDCPANTVTISTADETTVYKVSNEDIKAIKTLLEKIGN